MAIESNTVSQKEYLKKYLSDDGKKKKKKKVKVTNKLKRSQIIDDDIDLKTMRPLEDDEVELYQMDEDAPQIAGIVDDRPADVKAQEYYNAKRWKVFGGDDGVNVVDNMEKSQQNKHDVSQSKSKHSEQKDSVSFEKHSKKAIGSKKASFDSSDSDVSPIRNHKNRCNSDSDVSLPRKESADSVRGNNKRKKRSSDSDESPPRKFHVDGPRFKPNSDKTVHSGEFKNSQNKQRQRSDSDISPPRRENDRSRIKHKQRSDSDESPQRTGKGSLSRREKNSSRNKYRKRSDSDESPSRSRQRPKNDTDKSLSRRENNSSRNKQRERNDSDESPPRIDKGDRSRYKGENSQRYKEDIDKSPPRRGMNISQNKQRQKSDSDESPPRVRKIDQSKYKSDGRQRYKNDTDKSPSRREKNSYRNKHGERSDSDESPPRRDKGVRSKYKSESSQRYKDESDKSPHRREKNSSQNKEKQKSSSDESPPRKSKNDQSKYKSKDKNYTDKSPSRREQTRSQNKPTRRSDSDEYSSRRTRGRSSSSSSPPRKDRKRSPPLLSKSLQAIKSNKIHSPRLSRRDLMDEKNARRKFSDSDDSPPRRKSNSFCRNDSASDISPPHKISKKALYKPHDSSSSDETSKNKKMKTTLDGKQAGLQDAKQLRKELSDLKMREDLMFSNLDASVSGVGAVAIKRDRKTGQVRDVEKEKEVQKEKDAKAAVVKEKYYKWGKGVKQMEDAEVRAAEIMKEMNKPLARYANDEDLDKFLKAQEREGDPMLDYIKQKQKESTPLVGEKPIYKGSYNPNRFGIRPGHRWDGVVRSNGYEKEWFSHQNARKARDEDAYKWSTSDM